MTFHIHKWKWQEVRNFNTRAGLYQMGTCEVCGKAKAREVLL